LPTIPFALELIEFPPQSLVDRILACEAPLLSLVELVEAIELLLLVEYEPLFECQFFHVSDSLTI
jgi:hypothetical protein